MQRTTMIKYQYLLAVAYAFSLFQLSADLISDHYLVFYVSPAENEVSPVAKVVPFYRGDDSNPGTQTAPFATLSRARTAVRQAIAQGMQKNVKVLFYQGTYSLDKPVEFGPEDGGSEQYSVSYEAVPGQTVTFSGGQAITGWRVGADGR